MKSLANAKDWRFNRKEQIEALTDQQIIGEWKDLCFAVRLFKTNRVPWTMEMFWLFITLSDVMHTRQLKFEYPPDEGSLSN